MAKHQTKEATVQVEVVERVKRDAPGLNQTVSMVLKLMEDDSEERRKSSGGELFRNNELSGGVFLSD